MKKTKKILVFISMLLSLILLVSCLNTEYTVTFLNDGNEYKVQETLGEVLKPADPEKEGYTFLGWYLDNEEFDFDNEITSNITLIAVWEILKDEVQVHFDADGGTSTATQAVQKGNKAVKPTNPVKAGYTFLGWYLNDELFDFNTKVQKDIVLKAVWEEEIDLILISQFNELNIDEEASIIGIITSFGLYDYLTIEDESGAIAVRVQGYNTKQLISLGYKIGNRVTLLGVKGELNGLKLARTTINNLSKDEIINDLPKTINIENKTFEDLFNYQSHLISYDNLVITSIYEDNNELTFLLKDDDFVINAIYDTRHTSSNWELLLNLKSYDIVKIDGAILSYNQGFYFSIGSIEEITKTGSIEVSFDETTFDIFYLNDTHGAVLNQGDELGLAKIGNYIKNERDENSIFVTGGDMFQGQLISNDNRGAIMIEIFNNIGLDAFVIGNHEFDWGIDVILEYFNPNTPGIKANFPLLGANVVKKSDGKRPNFVDSHTIIERGNYKIGIIGVIGDGLESSISTPRVKDYMFTNAYNAVRETINEINHQVDFVIVINHGSGSSFNNSVSKLPKVKAVFNGHTHQKEERYYNNIPVLQSEPNGEAVGRVELLISKENGVTLKNSNIQNVYYHEHLNSSDEEINFIISAYYEDMRYLYEEEIISARRRLSRGNLAYFIAELVAKSTNSILGVQNSGGTRATIEEGPIMGSDVFKVFPFDNLIVTAEIEGRDLKTIYNNETYKYLDVNISEIKDYEYYKIATNDYVFYGSYYSYIFSKYYDDAEVHGDLFQAFYDYLVDLSNKGYRYFDTNDPFVSSNNEMFLYSLLERREKSLFLN